jgi:hypothetical protein
MCGQCASLPADMNLKAGHKHHGESSLLIVESNWFVSTLILPCRLKLRSLLYDRRVHHQL